MCEMCGEVTLLDFKILELYGIKACANCHDAAIEEYLDREVTRQEEVKADWEAFLKEFDL